MHPALWIVIDSALLYTLSVCLSRRKQPGFGFQEGRHDILMMRRLYRTTSSDSVFCGVCGGIARYLGLDSTMVRVATVLLVFVFGLSLWVYVIAALLMPKESALWK